MHGMPTLRQLPAGSRQQVAAPGGLGWRVLMLRHSQDRQLARWQLLCCHGPATACCALGCPGAPAAGRPVGGACKGAVSQHHW